MTILALLLLWLTQQPTGTLGTVPVPPAMDGQSPPGRTFHRMPLASLAVTPYPRAEVCGPVVYLRRQRDGDLHITLDDGSAKVVLEIVPELPIKPPKKGQIIRAKGVVRWDTLHRFIELHPLLTWRAVKRCPWEMRKVKAQ